MGCGAGLKWWLLPWVAVSGGCQAGEPVQTVGFYKLDDQRLTGETTAVVKEAGFGDMTVLVTIDTSGQVTAAKALENFDERDPSAALAMVRKWRFRPQTFDGKPVNAVGRVSVFFRERPEPADLSVPFPEAAPADTAITLHRGACYGSCPDYRVTIRGDGLVSFETGGDHLAGTAAKVHLDYNGHNVLLPGSHTARVDPAAVAKLLERFRAAHFFGLKKEYFYGATDNPTQVLTVRVGKASKTVTDYIGTKAGMPQEVRDLEEAVDALAGTARWVEGNAQTLAELDAAGFDYRSQAGAKLALAAARQFYGYGASLGVEDLLIGLIDRGVPLDAKTGDASLGATLVRLAAAEGREGLFDKLAGRNVLATLPRSALTEAFTGLGCSARIARALAASGADPHIVGEDGTALTRLHGSGASCEEHPERMLGLAETLIALGVPIEGRDSLGWTALMGCNSPELARLLLAHGADPNAREKDGTTPVLSTDDDRVALILLRAGSDPRARNPQGNVRSHATKGHWPATLAWLDEHGIR